MFIKLNLFFKLGNFSNIALLSLLSNVVSFLFVMINNLLL